VIDIEIGMSRAKLLKLADDIKAKFEVEGTHSLDLEGESNDSRGGWITVSFSNDDMERPEVADKVIIEIAGS
jgi:hypothetical protein